MQITKNTQESSASTMASKQKWATSIAMSFRKKRFAFVKSLFMSLPRPLHILDVGGEQEFYEGMEFTDDNAKIVLLNMEQVETKFTNMTSIAGDARDMHNFHDQEFEVVFSNAVIEHVGSFSQQQAMAREVQRVAKRYIVQTPNRYFPIEPHVLIPFFQFLPLGLKVFLATHTPNWGWKSSHIGELSTIRLMTERELRCIFPGASVYKEKFLGFTKSFILYKGW